MLDLERMKIGTCSFRSMIRDGIWEVANKGGEKNEKNERLAATAMHRIRMQRMQRNVVGKQKKSTKESGREIAMCAGLQLLPDLEREEVKIGGRIRHCP